MEKVKEFADASDELARNKQLFDWLSDDRKRADLYEELRAKNFPGLRFKSLLRSKRGNEWSMEDVYLLSKQDHVEAALRHYSVEPYSKLPSGGRFMLGLDDVEVHKQQRAAAARAMRFTSQEIATCAKAAVERASIRALMTSDFDLSDLAEQAALNFIKLLFGLRDEAHGVLQLVMSGTYRVLSFQIIGRHFVSASEANLASRDSPEVKRLRDELDGEILKASNATGKEPFRNGAPQQTVVKKLFAQPGGLDVEMLQIVVTGLIAGTIGNVRAAVPIVLYDFFTQEDDKDRPLIDAARRAARDGGGELERLIMAALLRNPPAAFLARTSRQLPQGVATPTFRDEKGTDRPIPDNAHVLLAMGADPKQSLVFGGTEREFMHQCVGEHLAWPLVCEIVRQVLLLPGLSQQIDPDSGLPVRLEKTWGVMSKPYKLCYQRGRRLNQQPLYVVLPIKEPVQENARKLELLTRLGAHIVEQSLAESGIVHFAWFMFVEHEIDHQKRACLALSTVYDGDFDAYVEHFASKVPLFDEQFKYLDVDQPLPISEHPKEFVENIRRYNRAPLADYFFSAYPTVSVAELKNLKKAAP